jgi:hypothetical protein
MKYSMIFSIIIVTIWPALALEQNVTERCAPRLTPVPFNQVTLTDTFWLPRLETQAKTLVPFALEKTQPAVENLKRTAHFLNGVADSLPFPHRYLSSDLYKVMEGVACLLTNNRDPALEKKMDDIIDIIAEAQKEDGYLYVAHITGVAKNHSTWGGAGMGDKPYSWVVHSHELYNMGHMYEAAIAYYRATGKAKWLRVAEKNARHINRVFFEGDPDYNNGRPVNQAPGHQEIELALTKLYRVTGNRLYLNMAQKFLDIRSVTYRPCGKGVMAPTYAQQHAPVAEQRKAVGHAVRAAYMYSAMADIDAITQQGKYDQTLDAVWHNIVDTKMHITGGLGAVHGIEGFGPGYVLPNKDTYNETCAAVGNVFFNFRMFLNHMDAHYMDVAEVALMNNALAGVNLDGNRFFYVNVLEADGETPFNHGNAGRSPWFGTACCPSNLARLIPQVSGMMYAHHGTDIYVMLYAGNSTKIPLENGTVKLTQETRYPFDGKIKLTLVPKTPRSFTLRLRIPTWAQGKQFVPGELYRYRTKSASKWMLRVNGDPVNARLEKGFTVISRRWNPGDVVELFLPMQIRFNSAIDAVENNRERLAVSRGPLVYCAEEIDNGTKTQKIFIDENTAQMDLHSSVFQEGKLKNIVKLEIPAYKMVENTPSKMTLTMVPYYAWNNRGTGSMMVWLATKRGLIEE